MGEYIKNYIWEFLACVVMCGALILNIAQGFYIPDSIADNVLLAFGVGAILLFLCYIFSYNRIMIIAGVALLIIAAACAFFLMAIADVDIVDKQKSKTAFIIYWFICAVVCIGVYLVTRFRVGIIVIFLAGITANALMEYLKFESKVWTSVLFAAGCIVLFMLRQFRANALHSSTANPKFARFAASAAAFIVAALLVAGGAFYGIVKPLNPPTVTVKLFEHYEIYDILKMLGITKNYKITDPDQTSNNQNNNQEDSDEEEEDDEEETQGDEGQNNGTETGGGFLESGIRLLRTLALNTTTIEKILLILAAVLLIFGLPPLIRFLLRKKKMRKISQLEGRLQMIALYELYIKKLKRLGFKKQKWETPNEFARRASDMQAERYFVQTCGFEKLTEYFCSARYAEVSPDDDRLKASRDIYPQMLKNARRLLGVKYIFKYYVL